MGGRRGREEREELLSSPLTFINGYPLSIYQEGGGEGKKEGRERRGERRKSSFPHHA
jgi:hypothetical protein